MKLKKCIYIPLLATVLLSSCSSTGKRVQDVTDYKAGELTVNSDGTFKILQLCDIHLSNKDNQKLQLDFIDLTISEAKTKGASLIVLDGDSFTFADKATAKTLFNFIDSYNIPWTFTFGNHDEQAYFSVTWLTSYLNSYGSHCIFKDIQGDDVNGNANFYIDVKDLSDNLFERIFIFDSNRYYFSEYWGYDYIKQNQIDWYTRVVDETDFAKSVAFFHIPLPEFNDVAQLYVKGELPPADYLGGCFNEKTVSAPKYNSGLFNAFKTKGSTNAVFCGHDHENDFALRYQGIVLSYGTNSTDRIYSEPDMLGGQLITIDSTHEFTTSSFDRIHHQYSEVEGK